MVSTEIVLASQQDGLPREKSVPKWISYCAVPQSWYEKCRCCCCAAIAVLSTSLVFLRGSRRTLLMYSVFSLPVQQQQQHWICHGMVRVVARLVHGWPFASAILYIVLRYTYAPIQGVQIGVPNKPRETKRSWGWKIITLKKGVKLLPRGRLATGSCTLKY